LASQRSAPIKRAQFLRLIPEQEGTYMALDPPFTAHVEKPRTALADAMKEMRTWLDHTALEPVEFKVAATAFALIAFDVTFKTEADARRFEQAFS
jgi:hypothetical protein